MFGDDESFSKIELEILIGPVIGSKKGMKIHEDQYPKGSPGPVFFNPFNDPVFPGRPHSLRCSAVLSGGVQPLFRDLARLSIRLLLEGGLPLPMSLSQALFGIETMGWARRMRDHEAKLFRMRW